MSNRSLLCNWGFRYTSLVSTHNSVTLDLLMQTMVPFINSIMSPTLLRKGLGALLLSSLSEVNLERSTWTRFTLVISSYDSGWFLIFLEILLDEDTCDP